MIVAIPSVLRGRGGPQPVCPGLHGQSLDDPLVDRRRRPGDSLRTRLRLTADDPRNHLEILDASNTSSQPPEVQSASGGRILSMAIE